MTGWIDAALPYARLWLDYQVAATQLPGCAVAVVREGEVIGNWAFGLADRESGEAMTTDHRFRVASHSKCFTATAILKLREEGRLHLDDAVGVHVPGLAPDVATMTLEQLLSHGSGLHRDGRDASFWISETAYLDKAGLRAELQDAATLPTDSRFKYSNIGFSLLGEVIEAITGESYGRWVQREIVEPLGLTAIVPDLPLADGTPMAVGYSSAMPAGRKPLDARMSTRAMASATGFISTAADLARFFGALAPEAERSVLLPASRRDMIRARWMMPELGAGRGYGLGVVLSQVAGQAAFGHSGGFQGFITRTISVPAWKLTVSVLTNAIDGPAAPLAEGLLGIFAKFQEWGPPEPEVADWYGRWWSLWGAQDLVPMGNRVLVADPAGFEPFALAAELEIHDATSGRVAKAAPYDNHGEPVARQLGADGKASLLRLGGMTLKPQSPLL
ncbi:serine hydrolase domain-containing protein [Oryzibacter oryziterrae]|uniref:serine hydrolase domain-containing protein n=1 Tax=Oryzibacter oryziterrae TaxID=2766474 RepID=UPI001F1B66EC|nr:serine hydrolase domain-containing protein [Oryzibacter oryziterrae]